VTDNISGLPQLLTLRQAAQLLAVSSRTLEREIQRGRFPRPRKIGRATRGLESDVRSYVESLALPVQKGLA
jgi:excisionase family DNA binding protein